MYTDYRHKANFQKPLIPLVEGGNRSFTGDRSEAQEREDIERDLQILDMLRQKLRDKQGTPQQYGQRLPPEAIDKRPLLIADRDMYEPQRINRKICWQYTRDGKKVPLFRRAYISG